ncbi:MAG: PfkB family carbohydrate kinase [Aigarchaeota archaeon]|nr:PfkB family carbohydrate kinase [Candidatus Pelearchaeum maunauluense]
MAQRHGIAISFDTNIRPPLWRSMDEAAQRLRYFVERADILFVDSADARIIVGEEEPDRVVRAFQNLGVDTIVMKLGPSGAFAVHGGERVREQAIQVPVEDTIGAGDALAGTFLGCFILSGMPLGEALRKAVLAGSLVVMTRGDQENLPTLEELAILERAFR